MAHPGDNHAIKADLAEVKAELKADVADVKADLAEVKADLAEVKADLADVKTEMKDMEVRLVRYIGEAAAHTANVMIESVRAQIGALDDKYRDVPSEQGTLRTELEAHVSDRSVHVAPRPPRPARTRRSR